MCVFDGTTLKKSFVTAECLEKMICRLMVGGGRMLHNCNYNTQQVVLYLSQTSDKHFFHQHATFQLRKQSHNYY